MTVGSSALLGYGLSIVFPSYAATKLTVLAGPSTSAETGEAFPLLAVNLPISSRHPQVIPITILALAMKFNRDKLRRFI